ncbi:hypothetical protein [Mastigocoleus testarum]|uniref:hypothetical protein n=1 Tax=Mastigocoleus testarum TaxID=996925 RepID=UPI00137B2E7A|nr:hypothetical protein [Mastigocoleus testarum]
MAFQDWQPNHWKVPIPIVLLLEGIQNNKLSSHTINLVGGNFVSGTLHFHTETPE